jgi:hypothetical protein
LFLLSLRPPYDESPVADMDSIAPEYPFSASAPRWATNERSVRFDVGEAAQGCEKSMLVIAASAAEPRPVPAGNVVGLRTLRCMSQLETIARPVARALSIYRKVARHNPGTQARRGLARHIKNLVEQGVRDPGRLTVHGLSYLRDQDQG